MGYYQFPQRSKLLFPFFLYENEMDFLNSSDKSQNASKANI